MAVMFSRGQGLAHGLSSGLADLMQMFLQNRFMERRQDKTDALTTARQMLQDFQTQANQIATPDNVAKNGPDAVQAQYRAMRRRLPASVAGMAGPEPDFASMMPSVESRLAPVGHDITAATKPEDVPTEPTIRRRMLEQHVNPDFTEAFSGLPTAFMPNQQLPTQQLTGLVGEANARRSALEAAEPGQATKFIDDTGTEQTQYLTPEQQRTHGPFQTGLTSAQNASREGAQATSVAQAQANVANDPTNQAGAARGAGLKAAAEERARLKEQLAQLGMTAQQQTAALQLADDFNKDSKEFFSIRNSVQNIAQLAKDQSPQSDIGMVYQMMHIYDPNSVVREGEFATAQNAAGVPERLRARWNQLVSGDRLTPDERKGFITTAKTFYSTAKKDHEQTSATYTSRAQQLRVPPSLVIRELPEPDLTAPDQKTPKPGEQRNF